MTTLSYDRMVRAMRENDASFDGRCYVGVHSTGIYCLPSCPARLPLLKNVRFYRTREEAIAAGLRGCKRCRAERYPDTLPDWLPELIGVMRRNRSERLTESMLAELAGVDITTVRRHFRAQLGLSPMAFHRRQRLLYARQLLSEGADYLSAAFACGYESASGFREAFHREFGTTPGRMKNHAG
ncbi:helix-turn-helix domain-containing protein [candidate division GN15 bacterium]|nr:helix-turn-helix domain-containing protein [candidate division GN15 bacterium]